MRTVLARDTSGARVDSQVESLLEALRFRLGGDEGDGVAVALVDRLARTLGVAS